MATRQACPGRPFEPFGEHLADVELQMSDYMPTPIDLSGMSVVGMSAIPGNSDFGGNEFTPTLSTVHNDADVTDGLGVPSDSSACGPSVAHPSAWRRDAMSAADATVGESTVSRATLAKFSIDQSNATADEFVGDSSFTAKTSLLHQKASPHMLRPEGGSREHSAQSRGISGGVTGSTGLSEPRQPSHMDPMLATPVEGRTPFLAIVEDTSTSPSPKFVQNHVVEVAASLRGPSSRDASRELFLPRRSSNSRSASSVAAHGGTRTQELHAAGRGNRERPSPMSLSPSSPDSPQAPSPQNAPPSTLPFSYWQVGSDARGSGSWLSAASPSSQPRTSESAPCLAHSLAWVVPQPSSSASASRAPSTKNEPNGLPRRSVLASYVDARLNALPVATKHVLRADVAGSPYQSWSPAKLGGDDGKENSQHASHPQMLSSPVPSVSATAPNVRVNRSRRGPLPPPTPSPVRYPPPRELGSAAAGQETRTREGSPPTNGPRSTESGTCRVFRHSAAQSAGAQASLHVPSGDAAFGTPITDLTHNNVSRVLGDSASFSRPSEATNRIRGTEVARDCPPPQQQAHCAVAEVAALREQLQESLCREEELKCEVERLRRVSTSQSRGSSVDRRNQAQQVRQAAPAVADSSCLAPLPRLRPVDPEGAAHVPSLIREVEYWKAQCGELAKQLVEAKAAQAQHVAALDRLGIQGPLPDALLGPARRTLRAMQPLRAAQ